MLELSNHRQKPHTYNIIVPSANNNSVFYEAKW